MSKRHTASRHVSTTVGDLVAAAYDVAAGSAAGATRVLGSRWLAVRLSRPLRVIRPPSPPLGWNAA